MWFGALGWSGSWRITVEQTAMQQVRVTGGFNPFDFGYRLKPGEQLETPPFYGGFTNGGFGEASRILHRFERQSILPGGEKAVLRPVLYNSWQDSMSARRGRSPWPRRPASWASNVSSSTMDGLANARTTMPAWVTGM